MSEETIDVPTEFVVHADGNVSLTFGPVTMDDLIEVLVYLKTPEGQQGFAEQFKAAIEKGPVDE